MIKASIFSLLLVVFGFSSSLFANEKPFIISGFDDVLRQAENTGLAKSAIKILEKDKTFTGMPELYTVISKGNANPEFVLVSGIATWFDARIHKFLKTSQFPENRLYLRNWLTQWSIEDFKIAKIHEIVAERPDRNFIVIFDNSGPSLTMVDTLKKEFGDKILAVYLHEVVAKKNPEAATRYYSAFDIALNEYRAGRMFPDELREVGAAIVKEKNVNLIFPAYAVCPVDYNPCKDLTGEVFETCSQVKEHIAALCKQPRK